MPVLVFHKKTITEGGALRAIALNNAQFSLVGVYGINPESANQMTKTIGKNVEFRMQNVELRWKRRSPLIL